MSDRLSCLGNYIQIKFNKSIVSIISDYDSSTRCWIFYLFIFFTEICNAAKQNKQTKPDALYQDLMDDFKIWLKPSEGRSAGLCCAL